MARKCYNNDDIVQFTCWLSDYDVLTFREACKAQGRPIIRTMVMLMTEYIKTAYDQPKKDAEGEGVKS